MGVSFIMLLKKNHLTPMSDDTYFYGESSLKEQLVHAKYFFSMNTTHVIYQ